MTVQDTATVSRKAMAGPPSFFQRGNQTVGQPFHGKLFVSTLYFQDRPVRESFPILRQGEPGYPLTYLDSAASAQKPQVVIDRLVRFYSQENANIHRGAYRLSAEATDSYEEARKVAARFLGTKKAESIVFTKGATEALNLVAHVLAPRLVKDSVILLTMLEHHSNIVPWQLLAARTGARIEFVSIDDQARIDVPDFSRKVQKYRPAIVAFSALSNAFGTRSDVQMLAGIAREAGALTVVDCAQAAPHVPLCADEWEVDFLALSGHKLYGPSGIGVLYGRWDLLSTLDPYQGGGDMIETVTVEGSTWAPAPARFEAGTPPIAAAIGLAAALEFIESVGFEAIRNHERCLFAEAWARLSQEKGVTLFGPGPESDQQVSIISFTIEGVHPHDIATIADSVNVQLRAGHHCAMPALKHLGIPATARASFGIYSHAADIEQLMLGIREVKRVFGV